MRVRLERLKTIAGKRWAAERHDRLVRIISSSLYWRKNRAGYTDIKATAGVYIFSDALNASSHCGVEKGVVYEFLPKGEGQPTQEAGLKAFLMLGKVA